MSRHGTLHSSPVVRGVSGLRSSSGREFGLFQEDQQGRQASSPVLKDTWGSIGASAGESGLILS